MPESTPLRRRSKSALFELKPLLDEINDRVEQPDYIPFDPVQFMHAFDDKRDQEIAGFLGATMAWGRRAKRQFHLLFFLTAVFTAICSLDGF